MFNVSPVYFPNQPVGGLGREGGLLLMSCVTAENNHDSDIFIGLLLQKSCISAVYLPDYTVLQLVDSSLKYGRLNLEPS